MKDDESLAQFIETLCTTCRACANLISLVHETEECKKCANSRKRQLTQSATPPSSPVLADKRNRQSNSATTSPSEKTIVKVEAGIKSPEETKPKTSTNNGKEVAHNHQNSHGYNNNNNTNSGNKASAKMVIKTEPNGVAAVQSSSTTQALRKVRFQHHGNANSIVANGNADASPTPALATSHCTSSSTSSSSLAGGTANASSIGKYLAPLVAEVHPEQVNVTSSNNSYYKSPTTLSSSASLPTSVSTPFTGCQSASSTALAAGGVTAAKAATAPAGAAEAASTSYTAITSPLSTPTSASANSHLRAQPIDWSIEEVIQYIESNDNSLAVHGDLFRKHVSNRYILEKRRANRF